MTLETLGLLYEICYWMECVGAGLMCVLSIRNALKHRGLWPYLTGAFFCIFLADVFYLAVWRLVDFPYVLSAGDLSYLGGLMFLATANIQIARLWSPRERNRPGAALLAFLMPLLVTAVYIVCIRIYPEILINYLFYLPVLAFLGYVSLRHLIAASHARDRAAFLYQLNIVLLVLFHLTLDYFSTLGYDQYAVQETIANALLVLSTLMIYPLAVRRYSA